MSGNEDIIEVELEPSSSSSQSSNAVGPQPGSTEPTSSVIDISEAIQPFSWTSEKKTYKPDYKVADKKTICFDCEATGTDPWDYRFLVVSFWDLSLPVSEMVTFSGWDEEKLTREVADYLNREKPERLVCYNNGYDQRCLLSRFMLYNTPVPGWNKIEQIDVMEILKKGTTQNIYSSQSPGAEEQWLEFFFGEKKPYSIEECFEGIRNYDLTRLILRNRTCVESEGCLYLLFRQVTDEESDLPALTKPTVVHISEAAEAGKCLVACEACGAVNEVDCGASGGQCWRCLAALPVATKENVVREPERSYDYSNVGLSEKSTSGTKKTGSNKS